MRTGFWCGNLNASSHLEDLNVDERVISKRMLKDLVRRAWIRLA